MDQDPLMLEDRVDGMDADAADRDGGTEEEKYGPSRSRIFKSYMALSTPCLSTYGPQDIISIVIPGLGDNIYLQLGDMFSL